MVDLEAIRNRLDNAQWMQHVPAEGWYSADVLALLAELEAARELIAYALLVEDGPCDYDHHGYCQAHPHSGADPEEGIACWFIRARTFLASTDTPDTPGET